MLSLIHVCSGLTETVVVHHHIQTSNAYDLGTGHLYVARLLTRHVVEHTHTRMRGIYTVVGVCCCHTQHAPSLVLAEQHFIANT